MIEKILSFTSIFTPNIRARGALKLKEAAQYLGVSSTTVRRLINRGQIQPNRALRHILIPVEELDRFLQSGGAQ